jgi:hypothetical protein
MRILPLGLKVSACPPGAVRAGIRKRKIQKNVFPAILAIGGLLNRFGQGFGIDLKMILDTVPYVALL